MQFIVPWCIITSRKIRLVSLIKLKSTFPEYSSSSAGARNYLRNESRSFMCARARPLFFSWSFYALGRKFENTKGPINVTRISLFLCSLASQKKEIKLARIAILNPTGYFIFLLLLTTTRFSLSLIRQSTSADHEKVRKGKELRKRFNVRFNP